MIDVTDTDIPKSITTLCDYINLLTNGVPLYGNAIYRGQSDYNNALVPSLFRGNHFANESNYIHELTRINPDIYLKLTPVEKLVYAQHYGLPTRLLDFTHSPLVALFFACCGEDGKSQDGAVFWYKEPYIETDNSLNVIALSTAVTLFNCNGVIDRPQIIADYINDRHYPFARISSRADRIMINSILEKPFVVFNPTLSLERAVCQDSVFMLYGFREIQLLEDNNDDSARQTVDDYLDLEQIRKRNEELSLSLQKENDIVKIKIEKEYKSNILHDLDKLGINVKTLFPEPEYQSKYIVRKVSNSVALDKNSYFIRFIR